MAETARRTFRTTREFLAWEERQPLRYEWIGGAIRAMAGGTIRHDRITRRLANALERRLRGGPCRVHGPNVRVTSPAGDVFCPDVFVRCGPEDDRWREVRDPVIVFEVLSPGTAEHDLTRKKRFYQQIGSLAAIVYVSQTAPRLRIVERRADGFEEREVEGREAVARLPGLDIDLPLAEIYEDIDFEAGPPEEPGD